MRIHDLTIILNQTETYLNHIIALSPKGSVQYHTALTARDNIRNGMTQSFKATRNED